MVAKRTLFEQYFPYSPPAAGHDPQHDTPGYTLAYLQFLRSFPAYLATRNLDELRAAEFARLDQQGHVYLDYAGGGLYAASQLRDHKTLLANQVSGNPRSEHPASPAMTGLVERTRASILRFFNADPELYTAVFTPNATGALRFVGESYPFASDATLLLTADNHTSVEGMREFARSRGAAVRYTRLEPTELRLDEAALSAALDQARPGANNLFAYPAQSNFTGVQHSLDWIARAQERGWDVLLDASAFAPTNRLDLNRVRPDFVDLSFYQMFGYPTGLGCVLVRKAVLPKLRRPWYAGSKIPFSPVAGEGHYLTPGATGFEGGSVNYLSIPAVELGLDLLERAGMDTIYTRVQCLTAWLIEQLCGLCHSNGRPVVRLYGPASSERRGGTVQVNFFDLEGRMYDCTAIEHHANARKISLRAGCHSNPGAREAALALTATDLEPCFRDKQQVGYERFLRDIGSRTTGALRASIGIVSNFADVYAYVQFARGFADRCAEGNEIAAHNIAQ